MGSGEVSFTVISMSLSLIAVFIPILLFPGIVGLLFHEFAVTLSIAILISLLVSLTVTPTMCAYLLVERRVAAFEGTVGGMGGARCSSASRPDTRARSTRCSIMRCWSAYCS